MTWADFRVRLRRFFRPPRRLQFTREGKYFVGITIGVGFAAINTGNNLLYLLLGMLLSLIIASGIMSESTLRGLEVLRHPPQQIHARRPFLMGISLKNGKQRLASFSIEVEDLIDDRPLDKKCYFLKIPQGRSQHTSYRHTFLRRGRYTFVAFRLSTKFPFALFRKSRRVELATEVIVYPALLPVTHGQVPRAHVIGEESHHRRGRRGEFGGLHDYRDGDDPRDIHWQLTARKGRMMVREYEDESARRLSIFLDNSLPEGEACTDEALKEGLERAISMAASMAVDYLSRGYAVRLVTRGESAPVAWMLGTVQVPRLLRMLALLPAVSPEIPFSAKADGVADPILVVSRRQGGPTPSRQGFGRVVEA